MAAADGDGDGLGNPGSETMGCISGDRDVADGCELPIDSILLNSDGSVVYNSSSAQKNLNNEKFRCGLMLQLQQEYLLILFHKSQHSF